MFATTLVAAHDALDMLRVLVRSGAGGRSRGLGRLEGEWAAAHGAVQVGNHRTVGNYCMRVAPSGHTDQGHHWRRRAMRDDMGEMTARRTMCGARGIDVDQVDAAR